MVFLLNNLGIGININVGSIWDWWPIIPLLMGVNGLFLSFSPVSDDTGRRASFSFGQFLTGLVLVAIGGIDLGRNLNLFEVDMSRFWNVFGPLVLMLVAIPLLWAAYSRVAEVPGNFRAAVILPSWAV